MKKIITSKFNKELALFNKSPHEYVTNLIKFYSTVFKGADVSGLLNNVTKSIERGPLVSINLLPHDILVTKSKLYKDVKEEFLVAPDGTRIKPFILTEHFGRIWEYCKHLNGSLSDLNENIYALYPVETNIVRAVAVRLSTFMYVIEHNIIMLNDEDFNSIKATDLSLLLKKKLELYCSSKAMVDGRRLGDIMTRRIRLGERDIHKFNVRLIGIDPSNTNIDLSLSAIMWNMSIDVFGITKLAQINLLDSLPGYILDHFKEVCDTVITAGNKAMAEIRLWGDEYRKMAIHGMIIQSVTHTMGDLINNYRLRAIPTFEILRFYVVLFKSINTAEAVHWADTHDLSIKYAISKILERNKDNLDLSSVRPSIDSHIPDRFISECFDILDGNVKADNE